MVLKEAERVAYPHHCRHHSGSYSLRNFFIFCLTTLSASQTVQRGKAKRYIMKWKVSERKRSSLIRSSTSQFFWRTLIKITSVMGYIRTRYLQDTMPKLCHYVSGSGNKTLGSCDLSPGNLKQDDELFQMASGVEQERMSERFPGRGSTCYPPHCESRMPSDKLLE
jgi:hypothetical protein